MSLLDNTIGVFSKLRDFGLDTYYAVGDAVGVDFDRDLSNQNSGQVNSAVNFEAQGGLISTLMENKLYLTIGAVALGGIYLIAKGR